MTEYNIGYVAYLNGRSASSDKIYDFIDLRIDSQADNYLSMVYTTQCNWQYALAMNKRMISNLKKSKNLTLIKNENT